jgi:hypothetical protein
LLVNSRKQTSTADEAGGYRFDAVPAGNAELTFRLLTRRVISAGLTFEPEQRLFGSIRVRHFGPRTLIEDASVTSDSTTLWNGEIGCRLSSKTRLVLEAFNIFDAEVSDIDYFYASRLPGEPEGGVEDIHLHPALPRSARIGIQFSF